MIYCCQAKCCHYIFFGSGRPTACPDCGSRRIHPATREERAAYLRRRTEALSPARRSG